jgi:hypothetical protein
MPSTRPKLILDEESFQGLLAAAFTIQQYNQREGGIDAALSAELNASLGANAAAKAPKNERVESFTRVVDRQAVDREIAGRQFVDRELVDREIADYKITERASKEPAPRKAASKEPAPAEPAVALCRQCGSALLPGESACSICEGETFRPGERLQRTWATMWTLSQEQAMGAPPGPTSLARLQASEQGASTDSEATNNATGNLVFHDAASASESLRILPLDATAVGAGPDPQARTLKLRFRRADLYLGLSVFVAMVALLWPSASSGRDELRPWERMLIAIGIAEAPTAQAEVHYSGDPNIKVWVDTHAALYYCPGDDLYGKSAGGYYTTQHGAQLDRFEPALRRACVP